MDASSQSDIRLEPSASEALEKIRAHRLRFTGSGGEYFRVWIVNVLLSIVTLGFYTPFARKRTAQYFYSHSMVAGSALEFTAQQRRMVFGFVLVFLLSAAYQLAVRTGQDTAVGLFILCGAALAPVIWASAMRFRLSNTRWRGLRLVFTANWKEIYKASWPIFALALVWIGVFYGIDALVGDYLAGFEGDAPKPRPRLDAGTGWTVFGVVLLGMFLSVLCIIRMEYNYRSLLVLRTRIGNEISRWKPVYTDFVKIWAGTVLVFLLSIVVIVVLSAAVAGGLMMSLKGAGSKEPGVWIYVAIALGAILSFFLMILASGPARAYRESRMFHLVWNNTGVSQIARFKCTLSTRKFVLLRLKNMLLTILTIGFYRPFARVAEYKMKFESVTLYVKGSVEQLAGRLEKGQKEGFGDALADAAGLDLIG
ncbi:YjgN family protein [Diaphorobacter sp. HDW4A]|uniref:YjgN family protein n=1 Tax=Diaphorobacter sp. HDW4A TaxID=2714924 RepID=UPI0019801F4F|nr:YjgN family protein [Diaphorobacter sp. HDW4A]